jgi:hypothetical protein
MSTEEPAKSPIADGLSKMQVALHMPCARCGYELRELIADGDCPECGEPIRLTIIEVVDPTSRRLVPIQNPKAVGNSIIGVVFFFFFAAILAVLAFLSRAPESLPIPDFIHLFPTSGFVWLSAIAGLASLLNLIPMIRMCRQSVLIGCRAGIVFTFFGLCLWSLSMALIAIFLLDNPSHSSAVTMLFDTCLPVVASGLVFSGFRRLVPRLGQRSRAFRQAQGSRQRMNDLLAALVVIIVGRTLIVVSTTDSNLSLLGLIVMVMSLSLVVIGLGYLLRNTAWIRNALISPAPALLDLLRPKK